MSALEEKFKTAPVIVFLFLGLLPAAGLYFTSTFDSIEVMDRKIKAAKSELQKREGELAQVKKIANDREKFEQEFNHIGEQLQIALTLLPTEMDNETILNRIYDEARAAGVSLTSVEPKESVKKEFYEELLVEVALEGSYAQHLLFLSYIAKIPRIVKIRDVDLIINRFVDQVPVLTLKGMLVAYRYVEQAGEPAQGGQKQ
jgi:Tfp pilus assembly protein PilO